MKLDSKKEQPQDIKRQTRPHRESSQRLSASANGTKQIVNVKTVNKFKNQWQKNIQSSAKYTLL